MLLLTTMLQRSSEVYYSVLLVAGIILIGLTGPCADRDQVELDSIFCYHCSGSCGIEMDQLSCVAGEICFKTLVNEMTVINGVKMRRKFITRGCYNNRNYNYTVGICTNLPAQDHGDSSVLTKNLCLCDSNYCNGVSITSGQVYCRILAVSALVFVERL